MIPLVHSTLISPSRTGLRSPTTPPCSIPNPCLFLTGRAGCQYPHPPKGQQQSETESPCSTEKLNSQETPSEAHAPGKRCSPVPKSATKAKSWLCDQQRIHTEHHPCGRCQGHKEQKTSVPPTGPHWTKKKPKIKSQNLNALHVSQLERKKAWRYVNLPH